jgi:hypothetical protein
LLRKKNLEEKEKKCLEIRLKNEKLYEENRLKLIEKLNSFDEKTRRFKEENYKNSLEKMLELNLKKEDIEDNLKEKERAFEYAKKQQILLIEEKNRKIKNIQLKKLKLYEFRKKMNIDIEKQKESLILKFNKIMCNKKNKSKDELINELRNDESYKSHREIHSNKSNSMPNIFKINKKRVEKKKIFSNEISRNEGIEGNGDFEFVTNLVSGNIKNNMNYSNNNGSLENEKNDEVNYCENIEKKENIIE